MKKKFIVRDAVESDFIYGLLVCECDSEADAQKAIDEAKEALADTEWQVNDLIDYILEYEDKGRINGFCYFNEFDGNLVI